LFVENKDFVHWQDVMSVDEPQTPPENPRNIKRPRPGHADLAGGQKFAFRDLRNILERASARETAARVACGAIGRQLLSQFGIEIKSHVIKIGHVQAVPLARDWEEILAIPDDSPLNCADVTAQSEMIKLIDQAKKDGDTLGGIFEVIAKGLPVGLGSHTSWNEKLDGRIAQALMSIHAVKAIEIGTAVANAGKLGSEVHDEIFHDGERFTRTTNRAGGLEGGITNGEELRVRGYMKPLSTLRQPLRSVNIDTKIEDSAAFERSDITAVPAAGIIGEAMLAIVLANSMREKFGGDSIDEMQNNYSSYIGSVDRF
jgi:chorismate synthase